MSFPIEKIQCESIYLRDIKTSDTNSIYEIYSDPGVTNFLSFPAMTDITHAEYYIDKILLGYLNGNLLEWAIVEKKTDTIIGTISFEQWDHRHKHAKLGFALKKKWWGKGIMYELLSPFIHFGYNELKLNRIEVNIHISNKACTQLFEKYGFQREGLLRERYYLNNEPQNVFIYSLLKSEGSIKKIS